MIKLKLIPSPPITLKIETVKPSKPEEDKFVELDMTHGNQGIYPSDGKTMKRVVIHQPRDLVYSNIREGCNIGGIIGQMKPRKVEVIENFDITENGTYGAQSTETRAIGIVSINVNVQPVLEDKTVTPTETRQVLTPAAPAEGFSSVTVEGIQASSQEDIEINQNGPFEFTPSPGQYLTKVKGVVNVPSAEAEQVTARYTANGSYEITPTAPGKLIEKAEVTVDVATPEEEEATVSFDSNGTYEVAPSTGKVLSKVNVTVDVESGGGPARYVTFTAQEANSSVKLEIAGALSQITLYYSTDNATWQPYTIGTVVELENIGDHVSFYGIGNWRAKYSERDYLHFVMTGKIVGSGDCNALLDVYTDAVVDYGCCGMFEDCTALVKAPELPVTTLAKCCYRRMFYGCTSLTEAPELHATELATYCYQNMFQNCTALTEAPELPATTLETYCYYYMFSGCTSLVEGPELPATKGVTACYRCMFENCSALTSVKTAITSWGTSMAMNWLSGVATSGTVYCPSSSSIPSKNVSGVPTGWTRTNWTPAA